MSSSFEDLKTQALKLSTPEREELVRALIASIDGELEGTPEQIATAWDEEIACRVSDLEAGITLGVPAKQVLAKIRAMIAGNGKG